MHISPRVDVRGDLLCQTLVGSFLPRKPSHSSCFSRQRLLSDSWCELCTMCLYPPDHELLKGSHSPPTATWTDLVESAPTLSPSPPITRQASVPAGGSLFNDILAATSHQLQDTTPTVIYSPPCSTRASFFPLPSTQNIH